MPERRKVALAFTVIALILYTFADKAKSYIFSDAEGYYMYLPALTKYGFADIPVRTTVQFSRVEATGRYYDKYTAGVAVLQAPFYAAAYLYTYVVNKTEADGYSPSFQHAVLLASLFYCFCGLFLLYLFFRQTYSLPLVLFGLACIFFGTNLMYYTYREPGAAHVYSFFLWSCLLYLTPRLYSHASWKNFALMALCIGLLVFIRPTNALGALWILFWDMSSIRERLRFIRKHFLKYAFLLAPFSLFALMQLELWRHMTGETIFFSYNEDPGFIYLKAPKIAKVLFHVHNGLYLYAPVLLLATGGLIYGLIRRKKNFTLIAVILSLATYFFASWWAWWFGGAYGHRCYVDLQPLFLLPLLFLADEAFQSRYRVLKWGFVLVCLVCIYYSIGMTLAYLSPWDGPGFGWTEYWAIVKTVLF